ncbi:MAG: hydrogenase iron-sulfur subunit [Sterolibacteriaceae bacterium MAG5]|nr:hydrogenase iron-sulfur subunit [Candidatus Nitricoxidireducens bremensis]
MSPHAALRDGSRAVFKHVENSLDASFGPADNPLRHLGAMGLYFLWILSATGLYLYIVIDTSIEGVYSSIGHLSNEQWYFGGILRSLHRYATDAFIIVTFLHILREWAYDRYSGFRLFSWMTGIPLVWLLYMSAIGGYWIVWDRLAQFSALATAELFDWLAIATEPAARNFLVPEAVSDRFFTFLVYIHIGFPLFLILGAWAHVNRISGVDHMPAKRLAWGSFLALLVLALALPAHSDAQADLMQVPLDTRIDWLALFVNPLMYETSAGTVWALVFGFTLLLIALPLLPRGRPAPVAKVDAPNCNGCRRCYMDCPYAAVTMAPHPDKPKHQIAVVDADNCAACGICVGACPSSTPFRSGEELVTGIDMPQQPINALRRELEQRLAALTGRTRIVVFGCASGAAVDRLAGPDTAALTLICSGMLPPSFVEYALRGGADGVLVTGCREGGCPFRFGDQWTAARLARSREPHLRVQVPASRLREFRADPTDAAALAAALAEFRTDLETATGDDNRLVPYHRRTVHHVH